MSSFNNNSYFLASAKLRCIRLGHPARVSGNLQKYSLDAVINSSDQSAIVRDIYKEIDEILKNKKKKNEGRGFREIKVLRKELKERERKVLKEILVNAQVVLGKLNSFYSFSTSFLAQPDTIYKM